MRLDFSAAFSQLLPRTRLSPSDEANLARIPELMVQAGYTEEGIRAFLDIPDACIRDLAHLPGQRRTCQRDGSPLARLVALFLLADRQGRREVEAVLGADLVATLLKLNLVDLADGHSLVGRSDLYPCQGRYFFTDMMFPATTFSHQVYRIGPDSYALARLADRHPGEQALDLCTGSGVHAILAAGHCRQTWGVDINSRALENCRINACVNQVQERARFLQGSLYEPVSAGEFAHITANPPFVATPHQDLELFRGGGKTGEELTEAIVSRLPERLAVGGTCGITTGYPIIRGSHVCDRLEQWLGGSTGWGVVVLDQSYMSRDVTVALHVPRSGYLATLGSFYGDREFQREFGRWLDCYDEVGIEAMMNGVFLIRRLRPGTPGWRRQRMLPFPLETFSDQTGAWLDALETYCAPGWAPDWDGGRPRRSSHVARILGDDAGGMALFVQAAWAPAGLELSAEELAVARAADGQTSPAAIAERSGLTRERVREALRHLGEQLVLEGNSQMGG